MNVATITMDPDQARAKLRAYRASRHKDAEEQYRQCAAGYQELAKGTPLINLDDVFRTVPLDASNRPRLAIAASDQKQVRFVWGSQTDQAEFETARFQRGSVWADRFRRRVNMGRLSPKMEIYRMIEGFALVPLVPADVRPRYGRLKNLFTLWEVEQWSDRQIGARAPHDPMLLKHIGGALYAVLAQWDLTDLERAILEGAATARR